MKKLFLVLLVITPIFASAQLIKPFREDTTKLYNIYGFTGLLFTKEYYILS